MNEHHGSVPVPGGYLPHRVLEVAVPLITEDQQPQPQEGYYPPNQQPIITNQPVGWMNIPQGMSDCPRGLEYLAFVDKLSIYEQFKEQSIVFTRDNNKFTIQNGLGELVYMALEDASCMSRDCECCTICPYDMRIVDAFENEIIHFYRPLRCDLCFSPCCLHEIEISLPGGSVIGTVKQNWSLIYPDFSINNAAGETILKISGPCCKTGNIKFDIKSNDGIHTIGSISNLPCGVGESFTLGEGLGLAFPLNLDVQMKAVCLGATFLIKSMYLDLKRFNRMNDRRTRVLKRII